MKRTALAITVAGTLVALAGLVLARTGPPVAVLTVQEVYSSVPPAYVPPQAGVATSLPSVVVDDRGVSVHAAGLRVTRATRVLVHHVVRAGGAVIEDELWREPVPGSGSPGMASPPAGAEWRLWPHPWEIVSIDRYGTVALTWGPEKVTLAPGQAWSATYKQEGQRLVRFATEPAAKDDVASALAEGIPLVRLIIRHDGWFRRQAITVTSGSP